MKRSELKKIIKPLVKECVQETLLSEGLLSNIVSEVAQGMGNQFLVENKEQIVPAMSNENSVQIQAATDRKKEQLKEYRRQLLDEIGKDAFNGVDLFEGTQPMSRSKEGSPLAGIAPNDPGVDIAQIPGMQHWGNMIKQRE